MSDHQYWEEQLQQKVGELLARRLGSFADDLQQVQTVVNSLAQRLPEISGAVTSDEAASLQEHLEQFHGATVQDAESHFQGKLEEALHETRNETENRIRQEYESKIQELESQLAAPPTESGSVHEFEMLDQAPAATPAEAPRYDTLKEAILEINEQRQQADVLSTLVKHAAQFAPRALFFVIKGGYAIGWKASGFTNGLSDDTVRSLNIPVQSNPLLHETIESLQTTSTHDAGSVLGPYAAPAAAESVAVPLVIRGKAAAILYADSGAEQQTIQRDALESLMHITAMAIELLPVRRTQPTAAAAATPQPAPAPAPVAEAKPEPSPSNYSLPVVTPMPAEAPSEAKEAMQMGSASAASSTISPPINPQSDDEVRAHNDARRFARLLVSEIKLYNEQKVMDGRRSNDLYERLKEDIDRSRQMYEKRVSSSVAAKFDYFYDELLHTLGEGDPAKLGRGCPGPTVPVS